MLINVCYYPLKFDSYSNRQRLNMDKDISSENEGRYDILQNAAGEIMILIKQRHGGPENPRFVYDGGSKALLYRSRESAVILDAIAAEARSPIKIVDEVLVVELVGDEVAREYMVPVRIVRNMDALTK